MSEVSPYRDDHAECEPDGITSCWSNGDVHPVGDGWHAAVAVIEEASDRADAAALASYRRKHGQDKFGHSAMRVKVIFTPETVCALISMLVNDTEKWSGWREDGTGFVRAGLNLLDKARKYRDDHNLIPQSEWYFN